MNQSKVKQLRKVFVAPFAVGDSRNKSFFRVFKQEYAKVPRPDRAQFMEELTKMKEEASAQNTE